MGKLLTFERLRSANIRRQAEVFPQCEEWEPRDWALAIAGEVGEMCNLLKKAKRDGSNDEDLLNLGREIADIVTYADLLADSLGFSLAYLIDRKFNEVSERRKSTVYL